MGRKKKPSALNKLGGNPGKRAINDAEPKPPVVLPEPPDVLGAVARAEYERVGRLLEEMKIVTELDGTLLAVYAQHYAHWVTAQAAIVEKGLMVQSPNGFPIQNPYLAIANRAMKDMKSILTEFGMSPSSRSNVSMVEPKAVDPDDMKAESILD